MGAKNYKVPTKHSEGIESLKDLLQQKDISKYINSGVLIFDTDAIRTEPSVYEAMRDLAAANKCVLADQDHLNKLFNDRKLMLNPAYNLSSSRTNRQR